MLASTVQFSTYDRSLPSRPRRPRGLPREARRYENRRAPTEEPTSTRFPGRARSLRTQQRAYNQPPISTTFPARPRTGRTSGDYQAPAELVSVPPSSTTPHARRHPDTGTDHGVGAALHHPNASGGECSLERR